MGSKWIKGGEAAWGVIKGVLPDTKFKGQKTVGQVKSEAAKSKLKMAKEKLEQTFKKTDESLKKLEKTVKKTKHFFAPKDF